MKQAVRWGLILFSVQLGLVVAYWVVESSRHDDDKTLSTEPPQVMTMIMPNLTLRGLDGHVVPKRLSSRSTLVHFWATWCPPCREELPGMLSLSSERTVDVVAIALDADPFAVERFLEGRDSSSVVLGDASEVERLLGIRNLPVTFLVTPGNNTAIARFDGARDWTNNAFVSAYVYTL